jgi:aminoglycoside phosphotransferase (APT) family kinase protein
VNGPVEVVDTPAEAAALPLPPLVVRRPLEAWLDESELGSGPVTVTRIGTGHSNATFLLERAGERMVLRRPPRPPLPPSAHDMLREARVLAALAGRARVPRVLDVCQDVEVLGAPFYIRE